MRERSAVDIFVALLCGVLLVGLIVVATAGTARRADGEALIAASASDDNPLEEREPIAAEIPTVTPIPETPTPDTSPTPDRPPTETPHPTNTPDPNRSPTPTRTPRPRATATRDDFSPEFVLTSTVVVPTRAPTATPRPTPDVTPHFLFQRPIASQFVDTAAVFYPYASTGEGLYPAHHGVEFVNDIGTPVLAAGDGRVVIALNDETMLVGPHDWDLQEDGAFYGNVVVIQHDFDYNGKPVYTLYGHMDEILVQQGELVRTGDEIGRVGMSGIALGPHVHFEVRVGDNDYWQTRNPQLWFAPKEGRGIILGQVLDKSGKPVPEILVSIQKPDEDKTFQYEYTYAIDKANPTPPDDLWQENLLMGEVPAGDYRIAARINGDTVIENVTVEAGKITWVWLQQTE